MRSAVMVAFVAALAGSAAGQTGPSGLDQVLACRPVRGDKAQLACFRRAADALAAAAPAPEAAPLAQARAEPTPFGVKPPRVKTTTPPQPRSASLNVTAIGDLGDGRTILTLADGSSWLETESEPIGGAVRVGQAVTLEKGALGGYFLALPHRGLIHFVRLKTH